MDLRFVYATRRLRDAAANVATTRELSALMARRLADPDATPEGVASARAILRLLGPVAERERESLRAWAARCHALASTGQALPRP